jgi:hypothetical protein
MILENQNLIIFEVYFGFNFEGIRQNAPTAEINKLKLIFLVKCVAFTVVLLSYLKGCYVFPVTNSEEHMFLIWLLRYKHRRLIYIYFLMCYNVFTL